MSREDVKIGVEFEGIKEVQEFYKKMEQLTNKANKQIILGINTEQAVESLERVDAAMQKFEEQMKKAKVATDGTIFLKESGTEKLMRGISNFKNLPEYLKTKELDSINKGMDEAKQQYLDAYLKKDTEGMASAQSKMAGLQSRYNNVQAASLAAAGVKKAAEFAGQVASKFGEVLGISLSVKETFNDILNNVKEMLDEATTSDYSTSLITDSEARSQMMKYGFTGAENFAFSQLSTIMGVNTDEDLMYMNSAQKEIYTELMDKYISWYEEMQSDGTLQSIQEAQLDLKIFKQEMSMKLLNWFSEHKEQIFSVMNVMATVLEEIFDIIAKIAELIPSSKSLISGITGWGSSSSTTNITVNASNTTTSNTQIDDWSSSIVKQITLALNS